MYYILNVSEGQGNNLPQGGDEPPSFFIYNPNKPYSLQFYSFLLQRPNRPEDEADKGNNRIAKYSYI